MRVLNLNTWWPTLPAAKKTAAERNARLFENLIELNPEVITMQECDPTILRWLISHGYQVALGLMSAEIPLVKSVDENSAELAYSHLAVGIASRIGLSNLRCHIYNLGKFWPKEIENQSALFQKRVGGKILGNNLNPVLLIAEVNGSSIGVTHGPWDITRKPENDGDKAASSSEHQKKGILELC